MSTEESNCDSNNHDTASLLTCGSMEEHMIERDVHGSHNPMDDLELEEITKDTNTLAQWLQRGYVNLKSRTKSNLKRAGFHEGTKLEMSPSGFKWKKKAVQQPPPRNLVISPGSPVVTCTYPPKNNFSFFKTHWRKRFAHYISLLYF
mmetsp:Transcript_25305/g.35455  ORF Transcript_25305/g.35455 Transcript_25305/m.35455 type:complete len:147 (+) Transcript_25305:100-540(+)